VVTTPGAQVARRAQSPVQVVPPVPVPHTDGRTAPQVCPGGHAPHWTSPPHPSATGPQFAPAAVHVRGTQVGAPHTLARPPPPQV
jgi:hypothetical protein